MPFVHGKNTLVALDGVNLSPYLTNTDFAIEVDAPDTTTYGAAWKTALVGSAQAKADFAGYHDPAEVSMRNILGTDAGVLTYSPTGGLAIGDRARMLDIVATAYAESSPVGGIVAIKWSALADGPAGLGAILHPLAEDTNTTTGADRDDGAATATGWKAHLHVTAVDAGSWVVELQDAATTDWVDVTGGAFAAVTAAGGQRIVSASGTTALRRHVRYIATRTGGTAGDGITFALAYART